MGTVERVGARSIILKTLDSISIIVPNSRLLAEEVINWTHTSSSARLNIPVGVAYGSNVPNVKNALHKGSPRTSRNFALSPSSSLFYWFWG